MKQTAKEGIDRYVAFHQPPGAFLRAVLENDLRSAVGHADPDNLRELAEIVRHCHWEIPARCWGSPETVKGWLRQGCAVA